MDSEDLSVSLKTQCSSLSCSDKKVRQEALENLETVVEEIKTVENAEYVVSELFICFNDSSDACKESSISLVTNIIQKHDIGVEYVEKTLSELISKFLGDKSKEKSEDVKLLVIKLLKIIIEKFPEIIVKHSESLALIIAETCLHEYAILRKETCVCAETLAKSIPRDFYKHSEIVAKSIFKNAKDRQFKTRVAAINALEPIVRYGKREIADTACEEVLRECVDDENHFVREAVLKTVSSLLLNLPNRYEYFHQLTPVMLILVMDDEKSLKTEAKKLWNDIGTQYYNENESKLKNKELFMVKPDHYPDTVERPFIGCRALLWNEIPKIVPTIIDDLENWMAPVRKNASKLLNQLVIHGEHYILQHLEDLLSIMYKTYIDDCEEVKRYITSAAGLLGYFVRADVFLDTILPVMEHSNHYGHFAVLEAYLEHALPEEICQQSSRILEFFVDENILHAVEGMSRDCIMRIIANSINHMEDFSEDNIKRIIKILITILAVQFNESVQSYGVRALNKLRSKAEISNKMFNEYLQSLLDPMIHSCELWSPISLQFNIFLFIVKQFTVDLFNNNFEYLFSILRILMDTSKAIDCEVIHKTVVSLGNVLDNEQVLNGINNKTDAFEKLLLGPIKNALVWRPGAIADCLRQSTASLAATMLSNMTELPSTLLEKFMPVLLTLLQDSHVNCRLYGLNATDIMMGKMDEPDKLCLVTFNSFITGVMDRLDDKDDQIRMKAVKTLKTILKDVNKTTLVCELVLDKIYQSLTIHLDDKQENFRLLVLDLLKSIAYIDPELLYKIITSQAFIHKDVKNELVAFLEEDV